jgi:DNA-directed RNA polymerase specialized sigma24 family protein
LKTCNSSSHILPITDIERCSPQNCANPNSGSIRSVKNSDCLSQREADMRLVRLGQRGNTDSFGELFNTHKVKIQSICRRMTNDITEPEDLTQMASPQAFRKLDTFRGDSALATWLHRVTINTALMHFRKRDADQSTREVSFVSPESDATILELKVSRVPHAVSHKARSCQSV